MTCSCETRQIGRKDVVTRRDPDCRTHGLPAGYAAHPPLRRHALAGEDDRTAERRLYSEATGWPWATAQTRDNSLQGNWYREGGQIVEVLVQWGCKKRGETTGGPRNVLVRRTDGSRVVRPFRGLRR